MQPAELRDPTGPVNQIAAAEADYSGGVSYSCSSSSLSCDVQPTGQFVKTKDRTAVLPRSISSSCVLPYQTQTHIYLCSFSPGIYSRLKYLPVWVNHTDTGSALSSQRPPFILGRCRYRHDARWTLTPRRKHRSFKCLLRLDLLLFLSLYILFQRSGCRRKYDVLCHQGGGHVPKL